MLITPGQEIDRYTVVQALGKGGMAEVYLVEHNTLGTQHALKVLLHASGPIRERLIQEGRVQAQLKHRNLVAVTDVLEVDGAPGLLMEYVEGPSLYQWLRDQRPTIEEAVGLFRGVMAGVRYAHDAGFIHRDLKPDNVLMATIDGKLVPKVADFGLAKALEEEDASSRRTRTGVAMGTPSYMAPEQFRDAKNVDMRADLFALGCILYELICGQRAFEGSDMIETMVRVSQGEYTAPESLVHHIPEPLTAVIHGCLTPARNQRIPNCSVIEDVLEGRRSWPGDAHSERGNETLPQPRSLTDWSPEPVVPVHGGRLASGMATAEEPLRPVPPPATVNDNTTNPNSPPFSGEFSIDPHTDHIADTSVRVPRVWLMVVVGLLMVGAAWMLLRAPTMDSNPTVSVPTTPAVRSHTPPSDSPAAHAIPESTEPRAQEEAARAEKAVRIEKVAREESGARKEKEAREEKVDEVEEYPDSARIGFTGADGIRLTSDAGSFGSGTVPAGTYKVWARFGAREVSAGSVRVTAGERITLKCDADFEMCGR